ncbi:Gfo/Idh/MocA family protein [Streptomyces sp. NPDC059076]|uniref:Gfo/Idh/MocA family protein n=1 Tax=unclassified Streptomyces TaxID=2593676 RepID=UPI0036C3391A
MTDHEPARKPRFGLLGAGPWAERTQAPALASHRGIEFAGVWARRPEAAADLAAAHGTRVFSGDSGAEELFADCDAVAFALPPDVQASWAVRAAEAGCHLLLDKPVATTVAGARTVAEAAERAKVASVVFCTLRFAAQTRPWIEQQAAVGGWFTAQARWLGSLYAADGAPSEAGGYAAARWRQEKGGLWDVGPHVLSVLIPVLGDVTDVTAARGPLDTVHLVLRHASGASSTVTLGLSAPPKAAAVGVELLGDQGRVELPQWSDAIASFGSAIDGLLEASRTGQAHECDVRWGMRLTQILAEAESQLG